MLRSRIKPGPNGKYSKEDAARRGQLSLQMKEIRKQLHASTSKNEKSNDKKSKNVRNRPTVNKQVDPKNIRGRDKRAKGRGLGGLIGGIADVATLGMFDFDNKSGGGLLRRVVGGTADALTGNRWDFDWQGKPSTNRKRKPSAKVTKVKPKSTDISPPGSSQTGSAGVPNITTVNMDGSIDNPVDLTKGQEESSKSIPNFSATIMRSSHKIKTLGIMV